MRPASHEPQRFDGPTAMIGVDWGTSTLRAYRLGAEGRILESVQSESGILNIENGAFAETLDKTIGAWRTPDMPVILSGMIGSRQGWIEVPYLGVPATLDDIAMALVRHPEDPAIRLVPGLAQDPKDQAPDVMRGEETQIIGAIGQSLDRALLIMPGTHSKWVLVDRGRIIWFATFMTGELFAVLKNHSILGRLMTAEEGHHDSQAFEQGLVGAGQAKGGLLQKLFSARTLPLFERLPTDGIAAYLSGLLIGSEINEALSNIEGPRDRLSITVIGTSSLTERYLDALMHRGLRAENAAPDAAAAGHYLIARKATLVSG